MHPARSASSAPELSGGADSWHGVAPRGTGAHPAGRPPTSAELATGGYMSDDGRIPDNDGNLPGST